MSIVPLAACLTTAAVAASPPQDLRALPGVASVKVAVPAANPAHRIINLVVENRVKNDPERKNSFSYTAYEKTIFTARMRS